MRISKHSLFRLKITVGCRLCVCLSTRAKTCARVGLLGPVCTETWRKLKTSRVRHRKCVKHCAEITLCGHHLRPLLFPLKKSFVFCQGLGAWAGHTGERTRVAERTRVWEARQDTCDDGQVRHFFLIDSAWSSAVYQAQERCSAPSSTSGVQTVGPVACR